MRIQVPPNNKCPEWEDKIPPERESEYRAVVDGLSSAVYDIACREVITLDHIRRWHHQLFTAFVPLDYYAGYFRNDNADGRICMGGTVHVAGVAGALPGQINPLMDDLLKRTRNDIAR